MKAFWFSDFNNGEVVKIIDPAKNTKKQAVNCETLLRDLFSASGYGDEKTRCMANSCIRQILASKFDIKEKDKHHLGELTIVQACSSKGFTIPQMLAIVQEMNQVLNGDF